jgi:hypothetical protein
VSRVSSSWGEALRDRPVVGPRHHHVEQEHVRTLALDPLEGIHAVHRFRAPPALAAQLLLQMRRIEDSLSTISTWRAAVSPALGAAAGALRLA